MMNRNNAKVGFLVAFTMFAQIVLPLTAAAQSKAWTSVGSAGELDEASVDLVSYASGWAELNRRVPVNSSATIRYNVVAVDGLFVSSAIHLTARFRDAGAAERVILRLRRYNLNNGSSQTLLTLDSNSFAPSASFQKQSAVNCSMGFDFFNNAYYVEAQLINPIAGGRPALGILQIGPSVC